MTQILSLQKYSFPPLPRPTVGSHVCFGKVLGSDFIGSECPPRWNGQEHKDDADDDVAGDEHDDDDVDDDEHGVESVCATCRGLTATDRSCPARLCSTSLPNLYNTLQVFLYFCLFISLLFLFFIFLYVQHFFKYFSISMYLFIFLTLYLFFQNTLFLLVS